MMKFTDSFKVVLLMLMVFVIAACGNGETDEDAADDVDSTDTTLESPDEAEEVQDEAAAIEGTITISAAASLTDALNDIADLFNEEHPEAEVDFNFGGSGALQQQLMQGAPADIFFSANVNHFETVVEEGLIDEENAVDLLLNELVLVVPEGDDTVTSFEDIENAEQIAIGTPETVPAGEYSMATYDSMGITEELESKFVYAEDVRQVLTYVESGNVDAGTVYHTDALTSDSIDIIDSAPEDAHEPIVYPVGMLNDSENEPLQQAFFDFVQSEDAAEVFNEYGFVVQ